MPLDKQNKRNPAKPITPALSSHFRSAKNPLTPLAPKLAGSSHSSPSLSPRRDAQTLAALATKEEPLASPLNNITPRSGARNSRIGTESPATPGASRAGAGARTRALSINESTRRAGSAEPSSTGLGISGAGPQPSATRRPKSAILNGSTPPSTVPQRQPARSNEDISPQFFRAAATKSNLSSNEMLERPKLGPKSSTFFYASSSATNLAPTRDQIRSDASSSLRQDSGRFFHADEVPQIRPPPAKRDSAKSGPSQRTNSPDLRQRTNSTARPPSPLKFSNNRPPEPSSPKRLVTQPTTSNDAQANTPRRTSVGSNSSTTRKLAHRKSASTSSSNLNPTPTRKTSTPQSTFSTQLDLRISPQAPERSATLLSAKLSMSPDTLSPRSTSLTSSNTNTLQTSDTDQSEPTRLQSPITVEVKSPSLVPVSFQPPQTSPQQGTPKSQHHSELTAAAAARRERKVLDLEISNSSLLAINKTLEREMRKQTAELRRFRRLSRSGRLSIKSMRTVSGASGLSTLSEDTDAEKGEDGDDVLAGLEDLDLGDSDSNLDSPSATDDDESKSTNSSTLSPGSRSRRKRARDEKKLMLDLSRHQQLLVESQRLSQSIRRCIGWSEDMISEGKRALDYKVHVGDVELGGRVLVDEHESEDEERIMEEPGLARVDVDASLVDVVAWAGPGAMQTLDSSSRSRDENGCPQLLPNR